MILLETICVAFSLFSALPMPQIQWNKDNMRYALAAFPLVGLVIALLCLGWQALCGALQLPAILQGAGWCLLPVLITGGIHLDGYADTWDALASHGSVEQRQAILKDPHIGTFAVLHLSSWFVASFALWTAMPAVRFLPLLAVFCLPRVLSGLALTIFPLREGSGLAKTFADAAEKTRVRRILLGFTALLVLLTILGGAWLMLLAAAAVFFCYRHIAAARFAGVSGDLAGWFLETAEIAMTGAWCLQQYLF